MTLEMILESVVNAMVPHLQADQLDHLKNVLYINFRGVAVTEPCTDLTPAKDDSDTVKIKRFIASKRAVNRQDKTLKQYVREIRNVLSFLQKPLDEITGMDLRYYYGVMREQRHIKMSTMQTRLHYLSSFWDFLQSEGLAASNPVKRVGALKIEKTLKKPYSAEDLEALRSHCDSLRDRALLEFLYSTGVRVSEAVSLNVGDIEMEKQELIVYGKGGKERKTYLTDSAKYYLRKYLQDRVCKEGVSLGQIQSEPLFIARNGPYRRLSVAGVQYMLRQLGRKAGVKVVHPHRFRRTIATDLLARGMPVEQVRDFLGHTKLDTTMIYCTIKSESVKASHRKYA